MRSCVGEAILSFSGYVLRPRARALRTATASAPTVNAAHAYAKRSPTLV